MPRCQWCGQLSHGTGWWCPAVKAFEFEFHTTYGMQVKRVEFHDLKPTIPVDKGPKE